MTSKEVTKAVNPKDGLDGIKAHTSQKELFIIPEMPKEVQWF